MTAYQLFDALPSHIEDALRESIDRFGVLVPVVKDQYGNIIDGHHRSRIADELDVAYRVDVHPVADDDEAREIARTLNSDRRHLTSEDKDRYAAEWRARGWSFRRIGEGLRDLDGDYEAPPVHPEQARRHAERGSGVTGVTPDEAIGRDGKSYPASRPAPGPAGDDAEPLTQESSGSANDRTIEAARVANAAAAAVAEPLPPAPEGTEPREEYEARLARESELRAKRTNLRSVLIYLTSTVLAPHDMAADYEPVIAEFDKDELAYAAEVLAALVDLRRNA